MTQCYVYTDWIYLAKIITLLILKKILLAVSGIPLQSLTVAHLAKKKSTSAYRFVAVFAKISH